MSMFKHDARRKLRQYQKRDGNWRLKGLLLAAFEDEEAVAEAWPRDDRHLSLEHKQSEYRCMHNPEEGLRNVVVPEDRGRNEMSHAREEFSKKELSSEVPRDKYIRRMLLRGANEELDTLWREELLTTVIEGATVKEIARDGATVIDVDSKKGDYPRGSKAGYASKLSEGGSIDDGMEDYDTVAFSCSKYGQGFSVSDEMIDHARINAIERQIRFTGKAIENALNRRYLNQVVDNTGSTVDSDQATPTYTEVEAVNQAVADVEGDDFPEPDTTVMHPNYKAAYFNEANIAQAQQAGSDDVLRRRTFDPIFGTQVLTASSGAYNSSSNAWAWSSNDDIGATAVNSDFVGIFMYQDISTKDFEDPIRDIRGGNARAWFDVQLLQADAHANIKY